MNYSAITPTSRKTIKDFGTLSEYEQKFLEDCQAGIISDFETADSKPDPNVKIRAELIRYMLLGGCKKYKPSTHGIQISGANILGYLDLENCHSTLGLTLANCTFDTVINARNCHLNHLVLSGSQTLGLNAQGINVKGDLFLRDGFAAKGEVSLSGATVGGQVECSKGTFENKDGNALSAQNLTVEGILFFRNVICKSGNIDFCFTKTSVLSDDYESWPKGRFFLNGLTYKTILGADIKSERRIKWLEDHKTYEFEPQPYEQLAKVLRELGHRRDSSLVLEAMEKTCDQTFENACV